MAEFIGSQAPSGQTQTGAPSVQTQTQTDTTTTDAAEPQMTNLPVVIEEPCPFRPCPFQPLFPLIMQVSHSPGSLNYKIVYLQQMAHWRLHGSWGVIIITDPWVRTDHSLFSARSF